MSGLLGAHRDCLTNQIKDDDKHLLKVQDGPFNAVSLGQIILCGFLNKYGPGNG